MSTKNNLLYFLNLNKTIISDKNWLISISSYIVKRVFLMFFTLYMVSINYTSQEISFYYFILFFMSFLFVYIFNFFKHQKEILTSTIIFSLFFSFIFLFNQSILIMGLSILLLFMFSEIYSIKGINSLTLNKSKKESQDTISIATLYSIILPSFLFFIVGLFSDKNNDNFLYFLISLQFIVGFLFLTSKKELKNKDNKQFNVFHNVPLSIHTHTFLSLLYNSTSFLGRFLLLPILTIKISDIYGFQDDIFMIFGIFIGLISISNLLYDSIIKSKEINYHKMMSKNVTILSIIWSFLSAFYLIIDYKYIDGTLLNIIVAISILLILFTDYFSKLWSIGFVNSLKEHSSELDFEFNKSLFLFNIYKNLGFSLGFLFVFLLYDIISFGFIILFISLITILYAYTFQIIHENKMRIKHA